jgi:type I restriction enzyme S subunit
MLNTAWNEVGFGQVATLQRGYDLPSRARKRGTVPVVTSTGITDTHVEARERAPGVVTGRYGTIGEVFFIEEDYWPHNTTLFVKDFHGNDPLFVSYLLRTIDFQSHSGKSGVPGVNRNDLHALRVSIPPTVAEQRAIAGALSDVDALIGALDAALAKKHDLKQAAMQQLLTGQTRLPSFRGEWEVKRIADLFNITAGGDIDPKRSQSYQDETHCYPIYSNALTSRGLYGYCTYADHQAGSITITARGTLGVANFRDRDFTAIGRVLVLKPTRNLDGRYFSEVINNRINFVVESTGVPQLTVPQISKYNLPVPRAPEQTAIAEVLSDMDAELAALEQRRDKTRALKQGMMQELLTGRTRLV